MNTPETNRARLPRNRDEQERHRNAIVEQFLAALSDGDSNLIRNAFADIHNECVSQRAWQTLAETQLPIPISTALCVVSMMLDRGDEIRREAGDSAILARALRNTSASRMSIFAGGESKIWRSISTPSMRGWRKIL
jgi:hypothetical protein